MGLKLVTPTTFEAVTLIEAKQHLRVDHADEDSLINLYIKAARHHLEGYGGMMGVIFGASEWEQYYDAFPCGPMKLLQRPLIGVAKVEYMDSVSGAYVEMPSGDYTVDAVSFDGWIAPVDQWPTPMDAINAVKVTFTAGHLGQSDIPSDIKAAVLLLVGHWYANRETVNVGNITTELPFAVKAIIEKIRPWIV